MIKTNKDLLPGHIVTSARGSKYVVLCDDAGNRGLFTDKGTWMRFNGDTLTFGKDPSAVIGKVQAFDTLPILDAVSEGIKMMYTGRAATAPMSTVYTREDPRVTAAKKEMDDLRARMDALDRTIARYR